jgi:hypothetical protein
MITKTTIRRFLWHHWPNIHSLIYNDDLNEEEKKELIDFIQGKEKK